MSSSIRRRDGPSGVGSDEGLRPIKQHELLIAMLRRTGELPDVILARIVPNGRLLRRHVHFDTGITEHVRASGRHDSSSPVSGLLPTVRDSDNLNLFADNTVDNDGRKTFHQVTACAPRVVRPALRASLNRETSIPEFFLKRLGGMRAARWKYQSYASSASIRASGWGRIDCMSPRSWHITGAECLWASRRWCALTDGGTSTHLALFPA